MILASDEKVCGDMHLLFVFQKIFKISKRKYPMSGDKGAKKIINFSICNISRTFLL